MGPLTGGEDARVHRVVGAGGREWALRVSYEVREPGELEWVSRWIEHVGASVPQAVPRVRREGPSFFRTAGGGTATLLPFVEGSRPRRGDRPILRQAASILARIHRAGQSWDASPPGANPRGPRAAPMPEALADRELDRAWAGVMASDPTVGPTHGDFYSGNLLERDGSIVAVLDWDDAFVRPLVVETAGAIFEFARNAEHRLIPELAREFVIEYRSSGGPLPDRELASLGLAMRVWVRRDAQVSLAYDPTGSDYLAKQIRTFQALEDHPAWLQGLP